MPTDATDYAEFSLLRQCLRHTRVLHNENDGGRLFLIDQMHKAKTGSLAARAMIAGLIMQSLHDGQRIGLCRPPKETLEMPRHLTMPFPQSVDAFYEFALAEWRRLNAAAITKAVENELQ